MEVLVFGQDVVLGYCTSDELEKIRKATGLEIVWLKVKGQIEKETVLGVTILYEYNNTGQIIGRVSDTQKITYEYNADQLLVRKIVSGNNAETTTYAYVQN